MVCCRRSEFPIDVTSANCGETMKSTEKWSRSLGRKPHIGGFSSITQSGFEITRLNVYIFACKAECHIQLFLIRFDAACWWYGQIQWHLTHTDRYEKHIRSFECTKYEFRHYELYNETKQVNERWNDRANRGEPYSHMEYDRLFDRWHIACNANSKHIRRDS